MRLIYDLFVLIKWLPKVTLSYIIFSLIYGIAINNLVIPVTLLFDLIDYTV